MAKHGHRASDAGVLWIESVCLEADACMPMWRTVASLSCVPSTLLNACSSHGIELRITCTPGPCPHTPRRSKWPTLRVRSWAQRRQLRSAAPPAAGVGRKTRLAMTSQAAIGYPLPPLGPLSSPLMRECLRAWYNANLLRSWSWMSVKQNRFVLSWPLVPCPASSCTKVWVCVLACWLPAQLISDHCEVQTGAQKAPLLPNPQTVHVDQ